MPTSNSSTPSTNLPLPPASISRPRQRSNTPRATSAISSNTVAIPCPNATITSSAEPRFWPAVASATVAPGVGPTQGAHTTPSNAPASAWPTRPSRASIWVWTRPAQPANGAVQRINSRCSGANSNTSPATHSTTAPTARTHRVSIPNAWPNTAMTKPVTVKANTSPADNANGAHRCRCAADDSTIGTSGSTHGERMFRAPGR